MTIDDPKTPIPEPTDEELAEIESDSDAISKIELILKENESVIRHLITVKEKFKPYKVSTK